MPRQLNRREFAKLAAGACCAAGFVGTQHVYAADAARKLELFDYSGVTLLNSRFKRQYQSARDLFFNTPNDNLLLGFRQRAGLAAPGRRSSVGTAGGGQMPAIRLSAIRTFSMPSASSSAAWRVCTRRPMTLRSSTKPPI